MSYHFKFIVLQILILWNQIIASSVLGGTLVKTSKGLVPVEYISKGDELIGCTMNNELIFGSVINISSETVDTAVAFTTIHGEVYATSDQLFYIIRHCKKEEYNPLKIEWLDAQHIETGMFFIDSSFHAYECIAVKRITVVPMPVYKISTTYPHNFFVYEQELLTHNFFPFIGLGISCLFGGGLEFGGVTFIASIASMVFGVNLLKKHAKLGGSIRFRSKSNGNCSNGNGKEPNDGENKADRKYNTVAKATFFKKMRDQYGHWREDKYRRKHGAKGLDKKAEYIKWDHLHNDVEAYNKGGKHLGSYDPETLQLYKPADPCNTIDV